MAKLDVPAPVAMRRVAIAAPSSRLRAVLVDLAGQGSVELAGELRPASGPANDALGRVRSGSRGPHAAAVVSANAPDLEALEQQGAADLLAGEAELDRRSSMAIVQKDVSVLVGWTPERRLVELEETLKTLGVAVVELPMPPGEIPPTLLRSTRVGAPFRVLVDTYGVPPYSDVDPTAFAAIAFVVMFGMMFGDVGHGLLLAVFGVVLGRMRRGRLSRVRRSWPLVVAAGISSALFGVLYGECFGPTGIVPTLWLAPLAEPLTLLKAALMVGGALLAVSYLLGASNRWRERGVSAALYAEGGLAGALVFAGVAAIALGWLRGVSFATAAGLALALLGVVLLFAGTLAQAGHGAGGITRGFIEIMDALIRIGSNIISFTRLAAFGMTHAALSLVTLEGARHLAGGVLGWILAAVLFLIGTAVAIALEGLVAAIQALRLEYYELFSRIFEEEGMPFKPFALPVRPSEDKP